MGALGALERNPERLGQIINFRDVSQSVLVVPISGAPTLTCILHTTRVHLSMHATNRDQLIGHNHRMISVKMFRNDPAKPHDRVNHRLYYKEMVLRA